MHMLLCTFMSPCRYDDYDNEQDHDGPGDPDGAQAHVAPHDGRAHPPPHRRSPSQSPPPSPPRAAPAHKPNKAAQLDVDSSESVSEVWAGTERLFEALPDSQPGKDKARQQAAIIGLFRGLYSLEQWDDSIPHPVPSALSVLAKVHISDVGKAIVAAVGKGVRSLSAKTLDREVIPIKNCPNIMGLPILAESDVMPEWPGALMVQAKQLYDRYREKLRPPPHPHPHASRACSCSSLHGPPHVA